MKTITTTKPVPEDMPDDAVVVWHWITDNGSSDHEQFMNCADVTSNKTSGVPQGGPVTPMPTPPSPPPPATCDTQECYAIGPVENDKLCNPLNEDTCTTPQYASICAWGCSPRADLKGEEESHASKTKKSLDQRLRETARVLQAA